MNTWFECKVKYQKVDENTGKDKKVTEPYLIDAISFTEAEARISEQMESMVSGEFSINNIKRVNYTDVFNYEEGDRWFKCKVVYVDIDEASGKEKKTSNYMLVLADHVDHAYERLHESLSDMIIPFEVPSISESPIMDIFPYFNDDVNEEIPENLRPMTEEEKVKKILSDTEYADENSEEEEISDPTPIKGAYNATDDEEDESDETDK